MRRYQRNMYVLYGEMLASLKRESPGPVRRYKRRIMRILMLGQHTGHPVASKKKWLHDFLPLILVALVCFYVVGWDVRL